MREGNAQKNGISDYVTLDVGCGPEPKGDYNIDVQTYPDRINPQKIKNFIRASAEHLPYQDGCFDAVYSSHCIEHVHNPYLMLQELLRVTKSEITIIVPWKYGYEARGKEHKLF
jgi:SAM-dependent methyltransferase